MRHHHPALALILPLLVALGGCAAGPSTGNDDNRAGPCFRVGKRKPVCADGPMPTAAQDSAAKQMNADPRGLTLYVLRDRWADTRHVIEIDSGTHRASTVPQTFVVMHLPAGRHSLGMTWQGRRLGIEIEGAPGEVRVVELAGAVWSWETSYRWEPLEPEAARKRLRPLRLAAAL